MPRYFAVLLLTFAIGCADSSSDASDDGDAGFSANDVNNRQIFDASQNGDWTSFGEGESRELQSQIDQAVADLELPGVAMAVAQRDGREIWVGSSGNVDPEGAESWSTERQFRIGSVTKTFTTAATLQLVEEGKVSLDDPVDDWVPGYFERSVLVRHLATNTSGIASYNYVGSFDESAEWTPIQLVEWAVNEEPDLLFEPGSEWNYSNTNFVLLGLIIEAATGQDYADVVKTRLLDPLGLEDTYVASAGDENPRVVRSFGPDDTDLTNSADPSFGFSAGAIVTTPRDLARWAVALYGGDVLSPEMLELMKTTVITGPDGERQAFGTFVEGDEGQTAYGHTGGFGAYLTYMFYLESQETALVAMTNVRETDLGLLAAYGWSPILGIPFP